MIYRLAWILCSVVLFSDAAEGSELRFEVTGKVLAHDGAPVPEAKVWANQFRMPTAVTADASGAFTLEDVAAGPLDVVAFKEGHSVGGVRVDVQGPGELTIYLSEPDQITLRIIDNQYRPLFGAAVKTMTLRPMRGGDGYTVMVEDLTALGFPSFRSGEDGTLPVTHLPQDGEVRFTISQRGYVDTQTPPLPVGFEQDIQLRPGAQLRGRIVDERQAGIGRARVVVFQDEGQRVREYADVVTDREGFYSAALPTGTHQAVVHHPAFAPMREPHTIEVRDVAAEHVLDLVLEPPSRVQGTVLGPDGEPMRGLTVGFMTDEGVHARALTQGDGSFQLTVSSGAGAVRVALPPRMTTELANHIPVEVAKTATVVLDTPIRLKYLPEIIGTVRDKDRAPVANALVATPELNPPYWFLTDRSGEFRMRLDYMPEEPEVAVTVEHPLRFQHQRLTIDVTRDRPVAIELEQYAPAAAPDDPENVFNPELLGKIGKPAPEWACQLWFNTDQPIRLADFRGKVVVLNLWGAFDTAGPTRARLEELRALHAMYRDVDDVQIVGVHDASLGLLDIELAVRAYGITFPVGVDDDDGETFRRYGTTIIPQTVLVDKQGVLRYCDVDGRLPELVKTLRAGPGP